MMPPKFIDFVMGPHPWMIVSAIALIFAPDLPKEWQVYAYDTAKAAGAVMALLTQWAGSPAPTKGTPP